MLVVRCHAQVRHPQGYAHTRHRRGERKGCVPTRTRLAGVANQLDGLVVIGRLCAQRAGAAVAGVQAAQPAATAPGDDSASLPREGVGQSGTDVVGCAGRQNVVERREAQLAGRGTGSSSRGARKEAPIKRIVKGQVHRKELRGAHSDDVDDFCGGGRVRSGSQCVGYATLYALKQS